MNNVTSKGTKENYRERVKQIIHKNPVEDCITPNANVLFLKIKKPICFAFPRKIAKVWAARVNTTLASFFLRVEGLFTLAFSRYDFALNDQLRTDKWNQLPTSYRRTKKQILCKRLNHRALKKSFKENARIVYLTPC